MILFFHYYATLRHDAFFAILPISLLDAHADVDTPCLRHAAAMLHAERQLRC